jgi:O-antigen ligase
MRELILWALVALSIPAVMRRPFLGVMIYLGANIVRPEMLFWGGSSGSFVFSVYYALILVSCFFQGYFTRLNEVLHREYLLMLAMLAAIFLSALTTQYQVPEQYYYIIELTKAFGICALLYLSIRDFAEIIRLQQVLLGCLTFLGVWGIEQQMRGNDRLEGLGGNAWGDSNGVAAVFVLFLPVALAKAFSSEKRSEFWVSLGMASVMVALIVCTKSRGGLLGLITCLVSLGYYSRKSGKLAKATIILLLLVMPFATGAYLERMKTMQVSDSEDLEGSARSRLILWQAGLKVFVDNPLLGTGFLTYPQAKMKYEGSFDYLEEDFRNMVFRKENKKVTHNSYIQMLSDCGLIGATPYILLIGGGIVAGFRARRGLKESPQKSQQLLWLAGLSAGVTGFSVCIITIDSVLTAFLYFQLVIIGILFRSISASTRAGSPAEQIVQVAGEQNA